MSGDDFGTTMAIFSILCSVVFVLVWIASMVWIYADAEKRGKTGCIWLLLNFFTFPLGLIAYLVLRDREVKL